jgi:hypothetical protein
MKKATAAGLCKVHPKYQGKLKPRADCEACREVYRKKVKVDPPLEFLLGLGFAPTKGISGGEDFDRLYLIVDERRSPTRAEGMRFREEPSTGLYLDKAKNGGWFCYLRQLHEFGGSEESRVFLGTYRGEDDVARLYEAVTGTNPATKK